MIYNDCYSKNYDKYEWLIFNDIDEFINLKNYGGVKNFLNEPRFKNCGSIHLNWIL